MLLLLSAAFAWTPTPQEKALVDALSARDGAPPCETLELDLDDPVAAYEAVVDNVSMPPWVPMQAARCLVDRHAEKASGTLEGWLVHPDKKGLAKLVVLRMDKLQQPVATKLARKLVVGPHNLSLSPRLEDSVHPEVRALVTP